MWGETSEIVFSGFTDEKGKIAFSASTHLTVYDFIWKNFKGAKIIDYEIVAYHGARSFKAIYPKGNPPSVKMIETNGLPQDGIQLSFVVGKLDHEIYQLQKRISATQKEQYKYLLVREFLDRHLNVEAGKLDVDVEDIDQLTRLILSYEDRDEIILIIGRRLVAQLKEKDLVALRQKLTDPAIDALTAKIAAGEFAGLVDLYAQTHNLSIEEREHLRIRTGSKNTL